MFPSCLCVFPLGALLALHHPLQHVLANYAPANRQDHLIQFNLEISPTCVCIKPWLLSHTAATHCYHYLLSVYEGTPHLVQL